LSGIEIPNAAQVRPLNVKLTHYPNFVIDLSLDTPRMLG